MRQFNLFKNKKMPLDYAVEYKTLEIIEILFSKGGLLS